MKWLDRIHEHGVHQRRTRVLAEAACAQLPRGLHLLDVGCGDGLFSASLMELRPDLRIEGVEVAARSNCRIPVVTFDGFTLPFPDNSFDGCMLIDVLHHTESPAVLLAEAARVGSQRVLLKDHLREGLAANSCLRFMDKVGNLRYDVPLPFNYLDSGQWELVTAACGLAMGRKDLLSRLYLFPANLVFGRRLNFMALLQRPEVPPRP
jgi:SAM-dependent methyltransferase